MWREGGKGLETVCAGVLGTVYTKRTEMSAREEWFMMSSEPCMQLERTYEIVPICTVGSGARFEVKAHWGPPAACACSDGIQTSV